MGKIFQVYRLFNILSLDIVIGTVICALFFGKLFNVNILPFGLMALALTVWIIYTADHLLDAIAIEKEASSERHRFHQKHFTPLLVSTSIAILIDIIVIFFTRKPVLVLGFFLAIIVVIYLMLQRYLKLIKELFVAFLYTCGVLLPSASVTTIEISSFYVLIVIQFFLIALTNLLLFSWFDKEKDRADLQHSFVTISGREFTTACIYSLGGINAILTAFLLNRGFEWRAVLILGIMNIMLLAIFFFRESMRYNYNYRLFGDAVFLIPACYLL
jgi:hypothetical protein